MLYDWIKAFHVIAVMAWMAGMLYLPRLFVYHAEAKVGSQLSETLKIMEHKLLRYILNPAMILAWGLGIWMLVINTPLLHSQSMHVKFGALLLMQIVHALLARARRKFARDQNVHTSTYFRVLNEIPTALLIVIVLMVVVKPFS